MPSSKIDKMIKNTRIERDRRAAKGLSTFSQDKRLEALMVEKEANRQKARGW